MSAGPIDVGRFLLPASDKPGHEADISPEHAAVMDAMRDDLLIAFLRRLKQRYGDDLTFPISEIDSVGGIGVSLRVRNSSIVFDVLPKKT